MMSCAKRKLSIVALGLVTLSGCMDNNNYVDQATAAANNTLEWAKEKVGSLPDSLGEAGDAVKESLPGGASQGTSSVDIKTNIDPKYAFVQKYLSGLWATSPYKRNCYGDDLTKGSDNKLNTGDFVEFSFDGDMVTQYTHYVSHRIDTIVKTVARIESAEQSGKSLGQGRTLVGEIKADHISTKKIAGISGGAGTPHGFSKRKILLVSGDFSAESPDFSGRAIYSNGVAGGPPQLYSCSGSFQLTDPP